MHLYRVNRQKIENFVAFDFNYRFVNFVVAEISITKFGFMFDFGDLLC